MTKTKKKRPEANEATLYVRLPESLHEEVRAAAVAAHVSDSEWARRAIRAALERGE